MISTVLTGDVGDEQEHVDRQKLCAHCGMRLTAEEIRYYGHSCNACEEGLTALYQFDIDTLQPGTRVTSLERNRTGVIEGLCEYKPGCYLVKPEAPTETEVAYQSRWICAFDQVEIVSEVAI